MAAIIYAAPHFEGEKDPENQIDTLETVEQITPFNIAYDIACGVENENLNQIIK